jgi:hypothetical protein
MRRPTPDETWTDSGLVCWIDPIKDGEGRTITTYIPWVEVRAIRKHLQNGGTIHDCPLKVSRWEMGEILKDMDDDHV